MSKSAKVLDVLRQYLNLILALAQIFAGFGPVILNIGANIDASAAANLTPVIPAGYTFSIWGVLFALSLMYALEQARPSRRENELFRHIGWLTAGAFLCNTVWELVAQLVTFSWPTLLIIILILIFCLLALFRLPDFYTLTSRDKWLVFAPISILAGWISAGTFVNLSSALLQMNFNNFGLSLSDFSLLVIIVAGFFAAWILRQAQGNFLYGMAIAWALNGIVVANLTRTYNLLAAIIAAIFATFILLEILFLEYAQQ